MNINSFLALFVLVALSPICSAHDDVDIGIESIALDKSCKLNIVVKNYGYDLPDAFYQTINPAFITIKKGEAQETLKSLRALDKKKALKLKGGTLTLQSRTVYSKNPAPIYVATQFAEEFGDYGAGNNQRLESMDCIEGQGQMEGAPIIATQPDVAITDAFINPETCLLTIEASNLTDVPIDEASWNLESGVGLMSIDLKTHLQAQEIFLGAIDSQKTFTRSTSKIHWQGQLPFDDSLKMRISVWRVKGDRDFSNNSIELSVPNNCIKTPEAQQLIERE